MGEGSSAALYVLPPALSKAGFLQNYAEIL
jgi:hypothetical protein